MNNRRNNRPEGSGYLTGGTIGVIVSSLFYFLSQDFTIAISAGLSTGITIGVALEDKYQGHSKFQTSRPTLMVLMAFGVLTLIGMLVWVKVILGS